MGRLGPVVPFLVDDGEPRYVHEEKED